MVKGGGSSDPLPFLSCFSKEKKVSDFVMRHPGIFSGATPTNIASVDLVLGCPNARAGVKIVRKKNNPYSNLKQPNFDPTSNYH